MKKTNYLNLDGNTLRTFLTVLEEVSVSRAADRLGVTQSAVSHTLDRLRIIFGDPLFVREGRGIQSTSRARDLQAPVEAALDNLKELTDHRYFDPLVEKMSFTIAANDFPIQLIFPLLMEDIAKAGIDLRIRFIPAGIPKVNVLQASRYRILITPTPPDDPNLEKVSLMQAKMQIFYDSKIRKPPKTWDQFAESNFVEVKFSDTETSSMALPSLKTSKMKPPVISVPNFGLLASMIKGSDRITVQIASMKLGLLNDLDTTPLPFASNALNLFLVWHRRERDDPAHKWLRQKIVETTRSILEG